MKKINILFLVVLVALAGCKKGYLDVNDNPNTATTATPELVLTNALNVTAGRLIHHQVGSFWGGHWAPSGSVSGFFDEKTYVVTPTSYAGIWTSCFDNLADYDFIEKQATREGKVGIAAIATVMKAYNYQILVDTYGNVPYSEAFKGFDNLKPKYDDAKTIYADLIAKLGTATLDLQKPLSSDNASPGDADIVFKGDFKKWAKFANTLKLKMLLRQVDVIDAAYRTTEIAKITSNAGGFLDVDALSNPGYVNTDGKLNQFWALYGYNQAGTATNNYTFYVLSKFFVDKCIALGENNPNWGRIFSFGKLVGSAFVGVPFGAEGDAYLESKVSKLSYSSLSTFDQSQVLMLAAESYLLQAEGAFRGWIAGTPKTLFESGITASHKFIYKRTYGSSLLSAGDKAYFDGLISSSGSLDLVAADDANIIYTSGTALSDYSASAGRELEAIITQKWLASFGVNGFEAWVEYRRTGFPAGLPLSLKTTSTKQPVRLLYPITEVSTNADNVRAQNISEIFDSKVFWDK